MRDALVADCASAALAELCAFTHRIIARMLMFTAACESCTSNSVPPVLVIVAILLEVVGGEVDIFGLLREAVVGDVDTLYSRYSECRHIDRKTFLGDVVCGTEKLDCRISSSAHLGVAQKLSDAHPSWRPCVARAPGGVREQLFSYLM